MFIVTTTTDEMTSVIVATDSLEVALRRRNEEVTKFLAGLNPGPEVEVEHPDGDEMKVSIDVDASCFMLAEVHCGVPTA